MGTAVTTDVAHGQDVSAGAAVETNGRLQHVAAHAVIHHTIPGHVRNRRRGGDQIRLGYGNQSRSHGHAGTEKITGNINGVAVHAQGWKIRKKTVIRIGLKQKPFPRPSRAGGGGHGQQKIIGFGRRVSGSGIIDALTISSMNSCPISLLFGRYRGNNEGSVDRAALA